MKPSAEKSFLFVLDNLEAGGIQRQILEVCRALMARGHSCTLAAFRSSPDEMSEVFHSAGVKVQFLGKTTLLDFAFLQRLRRLVAGKRFDLVHSMTPQASFWLACVLPFGPRPHFVGSLLNIHKLGTSSERLCEFMASRRMDAVFVNAAAVERRYRERIPSPPPLWRIYNGVHASPPSDRAGIRARLGIPDREIAIVTAGRLQPVKRQADLIRTFAQIVKEWVEPCRLHIIGDGPLRERLESLAQSLDLAGRVVFHGVHSNPPDILPAFDIFVLPSGSEGFPNALLEAMAAGLACVATKVGGVPEALEDGVTGCLVDPASSDHMRDVILNLLRSPGLRSKLGQAAQQQTGERFGMERMTGLAIQYYEGLVSPQHRPLAYIMSCFPRNSETFILREIMEMRTRGLPALIVSLKSPGGPVLHGDVERLLPETIYRSWSGPGVLKDNLVMLASKPRLDLKTLCRFTALHTKRPWEMMKALAAWPKTVSFAAELRRRHVRHIHAHWATIPAACGLAMSRLVPCGFSFTAHAYDIYGIPTSLPEKLKAARFVATCTERNKQYLDSLVPEQVRSRIHLVRHFLPDPSPEKEVEKTIPPVVICVGSLESYKGHDILIRAAGILRRKGVEFQMRVIGGGPREGELRALIQNLSLNDCVILTGPQPQESVFQEMARARVFAIASRSGKIGDNLPNVLVEASLLNVPCIATDIGSINELIVDGETGLLIPADEISAMADALEKILSDRGLGERLAARARVRALEMFDLSKNAGLLEDLFRASLEKAAK